jgi:hypothetical protein
MAEPTVNQLVTTTLQNYHKTIYDNVTNNNALLALLKMGNKIRVITGGRTIVCPLAYAEEDFNWYNGLDLLPRTEKETISEAEYAPAMAAASVTLSGEDLTKNRGREAILNLLEGKIENAERTLENNISLGLYSDGSVAKEIIGLQALVADAPGTGIVGGINPATWSFWRNKVANIVIAGTDPDADYAAVKKKFNNMWLQLTRGKDRPDLILADDELYDSYEHGLQENQRFTSTKLGGLGFTALKYKDADVVYDSTASGHPGGGYMLNTKYMKFEIYRGRNFQPLNLPDSTPDMDAITRHIAFMGALTLSNRMLQGRFTTSAA